MVVDDHDDARELLATLLDTHGYETSTACDACEALQIAAAKAPDVVVLDIGLPGMDGYELARRLRELPGLAQVRLIALTGYGAATDRERSREAGIDAHLVKPIDVAMLKRSFVQAA